MDYGSLESYTAVLGSNTEVVILIKWHYMYDFTVKLSPNIVNNEKHWFCLQLLVLVIMISTPSGIMCGSGFNPQA